MLIKSIFQQESIKEGILTSGWHAPSYAHTCEDINKTLSVYEVVFEKIIEKIKENKLASLLKGEIVKPVFRNIK